MGFLILLFEDDFDVSMFSDVKKHTHPNMHSTSTGPTCAHTAHSLLDCFCLLAVHPHLIWMASKGSTSSTLSP